MSGASSLPFYESLGPLIAYGTSLDIFSERGQLEHYKEYFPIFDRYMNIALDKTCEELSSARALPKF